MLSKVSLNCGSASHPRKPDSKWSWLVCVAGTFAWSLSFGVVFSYAVVMPEIIMQFKSSKEGTGIVNLFLVPTSGPYLM